jgi:hypothetical protein
VHNVDKEPISTWEQERLIPFRLNESAGSVFIYFQFRSQSCGF